MLKNLLRKIVFWYRASGDDCLNYIRSKGAKIGQGGNTLLSHSYIYRCTIPVDALYSWSVWKHLTGEIINGVGKVEIGNNVFIRMNATISETM